MKKTLNEDLVQNELREGSAFFRRPEVATPMAPTAAPASAADARVAAEARLAHLQLDAAETGELNASDTQADRPYGSPYARPSGRVTGPRVIRRHPFEFYQDQLEALRRLSLEEKFAGGTGSMSEMVREAVDRYLHQRGREERLRQAKTSTVRASSRPGDRASD